MNDVVSVMAPIALRRQARSRLASDLDAALLETMVTEIGLDESVGVAAQLTAGQVRGGRWCVPIE